MPHLLPQGYKLDHDNVMGDDKVKGKENINCTSKTKRKSLL